MTKSKATIVSRAPTRVDLAGGTLDLWPLHNFFPPCLTINVAIDIHTQAELSENSTSEITLEISDLNYTKTFSNLDSVLRDTAPELRLIQGHLEYWKPKKGFYLKTKSESPVGGGLGGSSSLCVSLLGAFDAWLGKKLSPSRMVEVAHNIEAKVLQTLTGTQDYIPPISGGVNTIEYGFEGLSWKTETSYLKEMEKHFLLVYTGKPHQSGLNNWEVLKSVVENRGDARKYLERIKTVTYELDESLKSGNWNKFVQCLNHEYEARISLSKVFSSPEIEKLKDVALRAGALAIKICGAGGGGCVLLWCDAVHKDQVTAECLKNGFKVLPNVRPVDYGLRVETRSL